MRQIIYLSPKDNIATIREKLEHIQTQEALLVVPPRYPELRNLVNLKLLKRYAEHLAIDLALVVRDAPTRTLAREAGLTLASSVDKGRRIELKSRKKKGQQAAEQGASQPSVAYTPRGQASALQSMPSRLFGLILLLGILGAFTLAFVYFVLPSAAISLTPQAEWLTAEMEMIAIPGLESVDYGRGQIPARTVSVEIEGTANTPATGKRDIPDAHAEGTAVFANKTNSPVTVPRGTIIRTGTGIPIRFYTVTDLELPAERGGHGRVRIIAMEPGPRGNVRALTINEIEGDAAFQVDVINDQPTSGGGLRAVSEITAEDRARVKNTLLQRMHQEALAKLRNQLGDTEFIPAESISVQTVEESYDKPVGEIADSLNLRLKVVATGTLIGGEEANLLLLRMLESRVPAGYVLAPESLQFGQPELLGSDPEGVRFGMDASGLAVADIRAAHVREAVAGKPADEAMDALWGQWDLAQDPQLTVSPDWIGRVPWIPYRIVVDISPPPMTP